jgi:hypothetical protein
MDWESWVLFLSPLAVALVAVWLGYLYQIVSLDRETRKTAYLSALGSLKRLEDLVEYAEQINFASWAPSQPWTPAPGQPAGTTVNGVPLGVVDWILKRSTEICGRFGLETDWWFLRTQDRQNWETNFQAVQNRLFGAILREQQTERMNFNVSIVQASSVTRAAKFRLLGGKGGKTHFETVLKLSKIYPSLDGVLDKILQNTIRPDVKPSPVEWAGVDAEIDQVTDASFLDIGTRQNVGSWLKQAHTPVPWPA